MIPRRFGRIGPKWPKAYWDDWLREPKQRKDRHFIRPEYCVRIILALKGVSNAQYSEYLVSIYLNDQFQPFTSMDLSYLGKDKWEEMYLGQVRRAKEMSLSEASSGKFNSQEMNDAKEVRIRYSTFEGSAPDTYSRVANWVGAMDNIKAGVPRTAYKGIVTLWKEGVKVHLVPKTFH